MPPLKLGAVRGRGVLPLRAGQHRAHGRSGRTGSLFFSRPLPRRRRRVAPDHQRGARFSFSAAGFLPCLIRAQLTSARLLLLHSGSAGRRKEGVNGPYFLSPFRAEREVKLTNVAATFWPPESPGKWLYIGTRPMFIPRSESALGSRSSRAVHINASALGPAAEALATCCGRIRRRSSLRRLYSVPRPPREKFADTADSRNAPRLHEYPARGNTQRNVRRERENMNATNAVLFASPYPRGSAEWAELVVFCCG